MQKHYDIIVVGAGGSGLAAAVSAAENGASVLVLEKRAQPGGTTGIAVGSLTANRTRLQQQAGISDDDPDQHEADAAKFADPEIEGRNNSALRRFFLRHSADTLHWLMDMGLRFHGPSPEPPNRRPRMHNVVPGAKAYIATLQARLLKLGGRLHVNAPVLQLIRDSAGRVTGVSAEVDGRASEISATRGVILAAGDYASNAEMIARFKGTRYREIEGINPHADGDGHRLAEQVGARLVNMDVTYGPELRFVPPPGRTFQQLLPASGPLAKLMGTLLPFAPAFAMEAMIRRLLVTWQHPEDSLFEDGAILVNRDGCRFCDERLWPEREIAVAGQPDKECFILLDERLIDRYSKWPHFISTAPRIAYAYVQDYVRLRPDVAILRNSLESLAAARGIPEASLRRTAAQAALSSGRRWALLGPARAWFTTTEGGAAISEHFEVLNHEGRPIPGLYAVGQNGLGGQILWGHGLHIGWAMTSGRLCGQSLASTCRQHSGQQDKQRHRSS